MTEEKTTAGKKTIPQRILLLSLYGLIILMIVFSFWSLTNRGEKAYNKCITEKCEGSGEKFCSKEREINNCCMGAGGILTQTNNQYLCVFE